MNILNAEEIQVAKEAGFDEWGLRHSINDLQKIDPRDKSLHQMADYVDAVVYVKMKKGDNDFIRSTLFNEFYHKITDINITSIGNLAYIALHFPDEDVRKTADKFFNHSCKVYLPKKEEVNCVIQ